MKDKKQFKIRNIFKSRVFFFVIGALIFGTIGVGATTLLYSKDVTYDNSSSGMSATTVQAALDELNELVSSGGQTKKDSFSLGDYVSMTPTKTSYSTNTAYTGCSSVQTINPSELNLWRVLNINSNGTIDMISEYVSSTDVHFCGSTGYANYIGELNLLASAYANQTYTIGTRYLGYSNQTEFCSSYSSCEADTGDSTDGGYMNKAGIPIETTIVNNKSGTNVTYDTTNALDYFVASRYLMTGLDTTYSIKKVSIGTNALLTNGISAMTQSIYSTAYEFLGNSYPEKSYERNGALRPIVTLKSTVKIQGGDGTKNNPIQLTT